MQLTREAIGPFTKFTFEKEIPGTASGTSRVKVYRPGDVLIDTRL